jgi:hypothetical protein
MHNVAIHRDFVDMTFSLLGVGGENAARKLARV